MEELKLLKDFENNSKWFHENIDKLRKENFTGKFVAIKNNMPIAADADIDSVIKSLDNKGEDSSFVFIEFVHPKGFTLLL